MHPFEDALLVSLEDIDFELRGIGAVPWADYLLNPRRLRGSDFLMRWSQGQWSEERLVQAVAETEEYFAIPYGPSGTAPDDPREFELYFERLEAAGLGSVKRPDLLVFRASDQRTVDRAIENAGGLPELPFLSEDAPAIDKLLDTALIAVECENSLWQGKKMPDYGATLTPQKRLGGKLGLKKSAVLPTVIIKEEDRKPLIEWQKRSRVAIHIWHVFYDLAFGLALDEAERLVKDGFIEPSRQVFQAPGGATTEKVIYKFPYLHAYPLAEAVSEPTLEGKYIADKNGHILPYVHFIGGRVRLLPPALAQLRAAAKRAMR